MNVSVNSFSPLPPESPACWVCGEKNSRPWKDRDIDRPLRPDDFRITDSRYGTTLALWRCEDCRFIFADGSDLAMLDVIYGELEDPDYDAGSEPRRLQMRWLITLAKLTRPNAASLLDVGAASGLLVSEAVSAGFSAEGIEPSRSLAEAATRSGVRVHHGVLPHPGLDDRRFDVVTLVDVIEHVADPVGLLRNALERLAPGGIMLVVTPDIGSVAAKLMGRRWWHLRLAHVGYFNHESLERAMRAAGLAVERRVRAKWFFRVDYLAERMERYLPLRSFNRVAPRLPLLSRMYRTVVPLDLRDSFLWIVVKAE